LVNPSKTDCFLTISKHAAITAHKEHTGTMLLLFRKESVIWQMSIRYRTCWKGCRNQLGLEAALMELTLLAEKRFLTDVGENIRGALWGIGENAGHIKHGLAKLRTKNL
jgi:hypothetical protein